MSEFVKQSTNNNSGIDKVDRLVGVNYSSSFTSKVELSLPPNATNIIFIGKRFLFRQNCFERKLKKLTETVGTKLRTLQWSGVNSAACRGVNTDKCPNKGLGCNVQWNLISGMCSAQEMENHLKVLELLAIKLAKQTFSKTLKHKAIHLQVDNMVALTYLLKMAGT